jgi:hypothetical protein
MVHRLYIALQLEPSHNLDLHTGNAFPSDPEQ